VSRENDSVLREVRNFLKAVSSCEQAATRTSRSAVAGPEGVAETSPRETGFLCCADAATKSAKENKTGWEESAHFNL